MIIINTSSTWFLGGDSYTRLKMHACHSPFFFVRKLFFSSIIIWWNNLNLCLKKIGSFQSFKQILLRTFVQPSSDYVLNCHNARGIYLFKTLTLDSGYLRDLKFNHSFHDTINLLCSCGNGVESTESTFSSMNPICLTKDHSSKYLIHKIFNKTYFFIYSNSIKNISAIPISSLPDLVLWNMENKKIIFN